MESLLKNFYLSDINSLGISSTNFMTTSATMYRISYTFDTTIKIYMENDKLVIESGTRKIVIERVH